MTREQWIAYARNMAQLAGMDPDAAVRQLEAAGAFDSPDPLMAIEAVMNGSGGAAAGGGPQYYQGVQPPAAPPPTATPREYGLGEEPSQQPPVGGGVQPPTVLPATATPPPAGAVGAAGTGVKPPATGSGSPQSVFGDFMGQLGAYGKYPWDLPMFGGDEQAAYNLVREMGLRPDSGNPVPKFIESMMGPLSLQAKLSMMLGGQASTPESISEMVRNAITQGKASLFDDIPGSLRRMASSQDPVLGDVLDSPEEAAQAFLAIASGGASPFHQRALSNAVKRSVFDFRRQAAEGGESAQLGPLQFLVNRYGYGN